MPLYVLTLLAGLVVTLLSLAVLCRLAPRLGLVDHPSGRKSHSRPTPVVGGLAIALGGLASLIAAALMGLNHAARLIDVLDSHLGFLSGAAILLAIGAIDDYRPVQARVKLVLQLVACTLAVVADHAVVGNYELVFETFTLSIEPIMVPFSILVMLTITNAINMIDGIDGLASGMSLIALVILAKATVAANFAGAPLVTALIGALVAFLMVNFPWVKGLRAKVFLGDAGSLLCGFTLAYLAIELSALPNRVFKPTTALWLFFLPVCDTIWLYLRRTWRDRAPFQPGRDHLHHLLLEHFSARTVSFLLVGLSAVFAGGAYLAERLGVLGWVHFLAWVIGFVLYGAVSHKAWMRAWDRSHKAPPRPQPEPLAAAATPEI